MRVGDDELNSSSIIADILLHLQETCSLPGSDFQTPRLETLMSHHHYFD
jgi:hypothetical protein